MANGFWRNQENHNKKMRKTNLKKIHYYIKLRVKNTLPTERFLSFYMNVFINGF